MLVVIYGTIALVMRGVLVFDHGIQFRLHRRQARVALDISPSDDEDDRTSKAVANLMMLYVGIILLQFQLLIYTLTAILLYVDRIWDTAGFLID